MSTAAEPKDDYPAYLVKRYSNGGKVTHYMDAEDFERHRAWFKSLSADSRVEVWSKLDGYNNVYVPMESW